MNRQMKWILTLMLVFTVALGVTAFAPFVNEASANQLYAQQTTIDNSQLPKERVSERQNLIDSFFKSLEEAGFNSKEIESTTITPKGESFIKISSACNFPSDCPRKNGYLVDCQQHKCVYTLP